MFSLEDAKRLHPAGSTHVETLKTLGFDSFIRQADILPITEWPESWEDIPDIIKNEILEYFLINPTAMSNVENVHSFVYLLLNSEVKVLNLYDWHVKGLWEYDADDQVLQMLQAVLHKVPNLEHLTIHCSQREPHTISAVLGYIKQLKNLKYLSLDFINSGLHNGHIFELPLHLPEMEILKLKLKKNVNEEALTNFPLMTKLKEFHFHFEDTTTAIVNKFYSWCINHLPNLRLVGQSAENDSGHNVKILYPMTPTIESERPQLENLHCAGMLPEADLPNLKNLMFGIQALDLSYQSNFEYVGEDDGFGNRRRRLDLSRTDRAFVLPRMGKYSHLTDLTFLNSSVEIYPILEKIGAQLTKFCFGREGGMDFFRILFLCPNLRQLTQASPCVLSEQSSFREKVTPPAHLQECGIITPVMHSLPTGLLKILLKAPNLETLSLEGIAITQAECEIPGDMVAVGFPKLENIRLVTMTMAHGCELVNVADMVKAMVCLSPKMRFAQISWHRSEMHKRWMDLDVYEYLNLLCSKGKGPDGKYSLPHKAEGICNLTQWYYW